MSSSKPKTRARASRNRLMKLEPRLLFDGAMAVDMVEQVAEVHASDPAPAIEAPLIDAPSQTLEKQTVAEIQTGAPAATHELLIIDGSVENIGALIAAARPNIEVIVLDPNRDGVQQIGEILSSHAGIDAVHIVSHGRPGEMTLGSTKLTLETMAARAPEIGAWQADLKPGTDLLLYGCEVAGGDRGTAYVDLLAQLTGTVVAASTDNTGSSSQQGNWNLEASTGVVTTAIFGSKQVLATGDVLLPTTNLASSSPWTTIFYGAAKDYANDLQANGGPDLIGDGVHGALYMNFDTKGTSSVADDMLAFRVRLTEGSASFSRVAAVGIDANMDNVIDAWVGVDNQGNPSLLRIWDSTGASTSPADTSITTTSYAYTETVANYRFEPVSGTNDPNWNGALDLDGGGKTDYFLNWQINFNDLANFLASKGITGITSNSTMQFVFATSTQSSSFNSDIAGVNGGTSSTGGWFQIGAGSGVLTPSNVAPVITSFSGQSAASLPVVAGTTSAFATITATDADQDTLRYDISGGADAAKFIIDAATGALSFITAPSAIVAGDANGDGLYDVTVRARDYTDGTATTLKGGSDTQDLSISVITTPDTTAPTLDLRSGITPSDNATSVPPNSNLFLSFNENIFAGSGSILIRNAATGATVTTIDVTDTEQVQVFGNMAVIDPLYNLAASTAYYIEIDTGAFKDASNNAFVALDSSGNPILSAGAPAGVNDTDPTTPISAYKWNFTTGSNTLTDITAPTLTATTVTSTTGASLSPADNQTGVAIGTNLVLTFSETVFPDVGYLAVRKSSDGSLVARVAASDASQVSYNLAAKTVTLNLANDLAQSTDYYVQIEPQALQDQSGNSFAGFSDLNQGVTNAYTLNFRTGVDTTAPTVSLVSAANIDGTWTAGDTIYVRVLFSEPVNVVGSPTLQLETGATDRIATYASGSGSNTLIFAYTVQANDTSPDLNYLATNSLALNSGTIKDAAGNAANLTLPALAASESLAEQKAIVIDAAPVNTVPAAQSTTANLPLVFSSGNGNAISVVDIDSGTLTVTLTATNGTLSLSGTSGLSFGAGDGMADAAMTFTGSTANVNAALNGLAFTATGPNLTGSVQVLTRDGITSVSGTVVQDSDSISITVGSYAPVLGGGGSTLAYTESAPATAINPGITVSDADSATLSTATITLANYAGAQDVLAFTNDGSTMGDIAVSGNAIGVLTLSSAGATATLAQWQAALRAVTYRNTSDGPDLTARTVNFAASDGTNSSTAATTTINITGVNDAPTLTPTSLSMTVLEDATPSGPVGSTVADFAASNVGDVDTGAVQGIAIIASNEANGTWYYSVDNGTTWNAISSVSTASSLLLRADASGALTNRLFFAPSSNFNGSAPAALTLRAWDQSDGKAAGARASTGVTGAASAFSTATDVINVTVTPVNDAPAGTNTTVTTVEEVGYTFGAADFGYSDTNDSPANGFTAVKITALPVATGTLALSSVAVTDGQTIAIADITAGNLVFTPAANIAGNDSASFTFQVQDNGGTSNGGVDLDPSAKTLTFNITNVNDRPVLDTEQSPTVAAGGGSPSGAGGTLVSSLANTTSVSDADDPVVGVGILRGIAITAVDESLGTWWYTTNGGTDWTQIGSVSATNALLLAANAQTSIFFEPNASYTGSASAALTFKAWDQSSGAASTSAVPSKADTTSGTAFSSSTDTADVTGSGVNQAPVNRVPGTQLNCEDEALVFSTANGNRISIADVDAGGSNVKVTLGVTNGTLTLSGTTDLAFTTGDGTADASMVFTGTVTNINNALAGMSFTPTANYIGSATLSLTTDDLGNSGSGDAKSDTDTVVITLLPTNDAPAGTNATLTLLEDGIHTFATADFGFSDTTDSPANSLQAVVITTLPEAGSLTLLGNSVTAGQIVSAADITDGYLKFTPAANGSGTTYTSFTFQVRDDGGSSGTGNLADAKTITFSVTAVNDAPTRSGTTATLTSTNEDNTSPAGDTISNLLVSTFSDVDSSDTMAGVVVVANAANSTTQGKWQWDNGGTWTDISTSLSTANGLVIAGGTSVRFLPVSDYNGTPGSLTVRLIDNSSGSVTSGGTVNLTSTGSGGTTQYSSSANEVLLTTSITAVNDNPTAANGSVTLYKNDTYHFTADTFGFSDADGHSFTSVKIASLPVTGTLSFNGSAVAVNDVIAVSGATSINSGAFTYAPGTSGSGANFQFTFYVIDSSTAQSSSTSTVSITSATNTSASVPNTYAEPNGNPSYSEGATAVDIDPSNVMQVYDAKSMQSVTITITNAIAGDELNLTNANGLTVGGAGTSTLTLSKTPAAAASTFTTALQTVTFRNTGDSPTASGTNTQRHISIVSADSSGSGNSMTIDVDVIAVNDTPVIGGSSTVLAYTENQSATAIDTTITITDPDSPTTLSGGYLDVSITANGATSDQLTVLSSGGIVLNGSTVTYNDGTSSGMVVVGTIDSTNNGVNGNALRINFGSGSTVAAVQALARAVGYSNTSDSPSTGTRSVSFEINDGGNLGTGSAISATKTGDTITLAASNDTPVNTVSGSQFTNEDTTLIFSSGNANLVSVADADNPASLTVTLTVTNGAITLSGTTGLSFTTGDGTADTTMTFSGSPTNINNALAGMGYAPTANYNGSATLTVTTGDGSTTDSDSIAITVLAVNDAPDGTNNTVNTDEDTAYTFTAANFGFTDTSDSPANSLQAVKITTLPGTGTLYVNGIAAIANQVVAKTDIDTGWLTFSPAANASGMPYATFTFQVVDDGVCGSAKIDTGANTMTINVNNVADAPVATGTATLAADLEDVGTGTAATVSSLFGGNFSDPNDTPANTLSGVAIVSYTADGAKGAWEYYNSTNSTWNTLGNIAAATSALTLQSADLLRFNPVANWNGAAPTLAVALIDSATVTSGATVDATSRGGATAYSLATVLLSHSVTSVNDAPTGADATITVTEDGSHIFATNDFGFTDTSDSPANSLLSVKVTTPPGAGSLEWNNGISWSTVTASQFVSAVDIAAGRLRFTPVADASGTGYASFTFQVKDDGGTANSGVELAASAKTLTIDVTAVNDAPVLADTTLSLSVAEDAGVPSGSTGKSVADLVVGVTDADTGAAKGIAITAYDQAYGIWYFTVDNGTNWKPFDSASGTGALLLQNDGQSRIFFKPTADYNGTLGGALTLRAWDQTGGTVGSAGAKVSIAATGGTSPYSATIDVVDVTVTASNDAPTRALASVSLAAVAEDAAAPTGTTVGSLFTSAFSDAKDAVVGGSSADTLAGVVVVGNAANAANDGKWQWLDGATWTDISTGLSESGGLVLAPGTSVRFLPTKADFNGTPGALTVRLIDSSGGVVTSGGTPADVSGANSGGGTRYSDASNAVTLTTSVTAVNDAPTLADQTLTMEVLEDAGVPSGAVGSLVSSFTAGISDIDAGAVKGIAVTLTDTTDGTWYYTTNGGTWSAVGTVSATDALLLADNASTRLYFAPSAGWHGAVATGLTLRAWDTTAGTAGSKYDASATGGTSAFSTLTDTVAITVTSVNDAPEGADKTIWTGKNTNYTFATADFGFTDPNDNSPANTLLAVKITSLPAAGMLQYDTTGSGNWVAITLNQVVSAADIGSNRLRYAPATDDTGLGVAGFQFRVQDTGDTLNSGVDLSTADNTILFNVGSQVPPVLSGGSTLTYSETGTAGVINSFITVYDADNPTLESAQVSVTGGYVVGEDVLAFSNDDALTYGNITTASWDPVNGILSLSSAGATATQAQWQAALRTVTYLNTADAPTMVQRTISFMANDGTSDSLQVSTALTIDRMNDAPTIGGAVATLNYVENQAATAIDANIAITDPDNPTSLNGGYLRLSITANGAAEDQLSVLSTGGIALLGSTVTYNPGSGAVAIGTIDATMDGVNGAALQINLGTGSSSAAVQALARAIGYANTSEAPSTATRSVSFTINDGGNSGTGGALSASKTTDTITVASVNDAPVGSNASLSVQTSQAYLFAQADFGFTDPVDTPPDSLYAVKITALPGSGTLEWKNGVDTWVAVTQDQFVSASDIAASKLRFSAPGSSGSTSFTFRVQDSGGTLNSGIDLDTADRTASVTITAGPPPMITGLTDLAYTENQAAAAVNPALVLTDTDSLNMTGATVSISAGFNSAQDLLAASTGGTSISANYNTGTGVLTLSGTDSIANYQTVLRSVTYANTSDAPTTAARMIAVVVQDDSSPTPNSSSTGSSTVTVAAENDAPVLAGTAPILGTVNEDAAAPSGGVGTLVSSLIGDITDPDGAAVAKGVAITSLSTASGTWHYSTDGGTSWTQISSAPSSSAALLLASDANTRLYFKPAANFNGTVDPAVTFHAWDQTTGTNGGTANTTTNGGTTAFSTATDTASITVSSINDAPTGTNFIVYVASGSPVKTFATADFGFSDPNDSSSPNTFQTLLITSLPSGGTLKDNGVAITTATLGSPYTISTADIAAGRLTYDAGAGTGTNYGNFNFLVQDDGGTANGGANTDPTERTARIDVLATLPPVLSGTSTLNYTENQAATAINTSITLTDADSTNMSGATVSISGSFVAGEDVLSFTNTGTITGSYNAATGVLTLSGTDTKANYEAALRAVKYSNSSDQPNITSRTVSFVAVDNNSNASASVTSTVNVASVNDAPVATADTDAVNENATVTRTALNGVIQGAGIDTDADNSTISLTVSGAIAGTDPVAQGTGVDVSLAGTYGHLTLAADGSYSYVADQPAADALADGATADDVFTYTATDPSGAVSNTATLTITVTGIDDTAPSAPTVALTTDTGSSSGDAITKTAGLTPSGVESGATVEYSS
ncbi:MAG: DUF4347 domain-containing protein, partial [Sulfuritalea sp.]|nr:DUF4347 domain-containing protein [Sulfuritalea sp.]